MLKGSDSSSDIAGRPLAPPAQVAGALHDEAGINHLQARSSISAHM